MLIKTGVDTDTGENGTFLAWLFSKKMLRYCHSPVVVGVCVSVVLQKL